MNSKEFSLEIEKIKKEKRGISYLDAMLHYCEMNEIDPSTIGSLTSKALKEKIKIEAMNLNLLKQKAGGNLPI